MFDKEFSECLFVCMRESWWSTITHDWDYIVGPLNGLFGGHVPWSDSPNEALQKLLDMEDVFARHGERLVVLQVVWRLRSLMNMIMDGDVTRDTHDDQAAPKWKLWRAIDLKVFPYLVHISGTKDLDDALVNTDVPNAEPNSSDDIQQFSPNISETDPIEYTPRDPAVERIPVATPKRKRRREQSPTRCARAALADVLQRARDSV